MEIGEVSDFEAKYKIIISTFKKLNYLLNKEASTGPLSKGIWMPLSFPVSSSCWVSDFLSYSGKVSEDFMGLRMRERRTKK